jgi:hypothetical protein
LLPVHRAIAFVIVRKPYTRTLSPAPGTPGVISFDGEANWLEGAQHVGAYLVIPVTTLFITA